jgi:hypothetical protein
MQLPAVPPSANVQVFFMWQSALEAQLVLQAPALASQAYFPQDVVDPALQLPFRQVAAPMRLPLLPSHAAGAQAVPLA